MRRIFYRVAAHFRIFDIEKLLRLPYKDARIQQVLRWISYEQVEPFGELRADYRAALIASIAANIGGEYRRVPKDGKMFTVEECLLTFGVEKKEYKQPVDEQLMIIKILAETLGSAKE